MKSTRRIDAITSKTNKSTAVSALPQPGGAEILRAKKEGKEKQAAPYMMAHQQANRVSFGRATL
jgi:hypothetical protein